MPLGHLSSIWLECAHCTSLIKLIVEVKAHYLNWKQARQTLACALTLLKEQSAAIFCLKRNRAEKLIASTVKNIIKPSSWLFSRWKYLGKENEQSQQRKLGLFNAVLHKFQLIFQEMAGRNFTSFCLFNYSLEIFLVWLDSRILLLH